jgi:hypothetical protein
MKECFVDIISRQKKGRTDGQDRQQTSWHNFGSSNCYTYLFVVYLMTFVNNSDYVASNDWLNLKYGKMSQDLLGKLRKPTQLCQGGWCTEHLPHMYHQKRYLLGQLLLIPYYYLCYHFYARYLQLYT